MYLSSLAFCTGAWEAGRAHTVSSLTPFPGAGPGAGRGRQGRRPAGIRAPRQAFGTLAPRRSGRVGVAHPPHTPEPQPRRPAPAGPLRQGPGTFRSGEGDAATRAAGPTRRLARRACSARSFGRHRCSAHVGLGLRGEAGAGRPWRRSSRPSPHHGERPRLYPGGMEVSRGHSGGGPLAAFLRARRNGARPEQHRLAVGAQRQVPGLRRDEVAFLAGISTDYYVRLEQGRERRPSPAVVEGLCQALLLDTVAARYLRELTITGTAVGEETPRMGADRLEAVDQLLGSMTVPALLVNRWLDIVGSNILGDFLHEGMEPRDNYARLVFLAPGAQAFFTEWPELARCMVAALRAQAGSEVGSARLTQLLKQLAAHSDVFRIAWGEHHLYEKAIDRKLFQHPRVGSLALDQHVLELPGSDGHRIWVFHPADDATSNALLRLASSAPPFGRPSPEAADLTTKEGNRRSGCEREDQAPGAA
ncbi:helix-turn-helix domain-containing protein [Streptomyces celluloflavus]